MFTDSRSPFHDVGRSRAPAGGDPRGRSLVWLAAAWTLGTIVLLFFAQSLREELWIIEMFVEMAWFATGLVLLAVCSFVAARRRGRRPVIATGWMAAVLCAAIFTGGYLAHAGADWRMRRRFERNLPRYQRAVTMVRRDRLGPGTHHSGVMFVVDEGPPVRVAFPWPGGVIDNWQGIVYDPTGEVLKANRFGRTWSTSGDPPLAGVVKLFGGDMFYCEAVRRPWYFCQFT